MSGSAPQPGDGPGEDDQPRSGLLDDEWTRSVFLAIAAFLVVLAVASGLLITLGPIVFS